MSLTNSFGDLAKRIQKLQDSMKETKIRMELMEFVGESDAGLVKISITGSFVVKHIEIDPSLLAHDKALLPDLLIAAMNSALRKVESTTKGVMQDMIQGNGYM